MFQKYHHYLIQELLNKDDVTTQLFLLFCLAPIHDASLALADSQLLQTLIQMKGHQTQRLQIFTVLCKFEDFCIKLKDIDRILHLLVSSLSDKQHVNSGVRLIAALSSHPTGCQILNDNGVLELFTQLFLSSSCDDTVTTQTILRNVAKNGCDIPQVSLIVSCLMQDMMYDHSKKCEIMDTLVALVETVPGSVQEHDLQRIVMQQLNQENPLLILLSLRLFSVCDVNVLRNIYPQLLGAIHGLLNNPQLLYPEIIKTSLVIVNNIAKQYDLSDFLKKTELIRFINEVIDLLPENDKRIEEFRTLSNSLLQKT